MANKKSARKSKTITKTELKKIRAELIKKKARILEELLSLKGGSLKKSLKDAAGDLSGYSFHMADQATDNYDREFSLNLASDSQKLIYAIDEALGRINEKNYGRCSKCNKEISRKRLHAIPYAILCIDCQRKEESK